MSMLKSRRRDVKRSNINATASNQNKKGVYFENETSDVKQTQQVPSDRSVLKSNFECRWGQKSKLADRSLVSSLRKPTIFQVIVEGMQEVSWMDILQKDFIFSTTEATSNRRKDIMGSKMIRNLADHVTGCREG